MIRESAFAGEDLDGQMGPPGIEIKGTEDMVAAVEAEQDAELLKAEAERQRFVSTLAGHIASAYEENKRAREESGIEEEMINSLYQVNGEYTAQELSRIGNRSTIWMNLTATKSRAGRSWIKDLLMPANAFPMEFRPTPVQELPESVRAEIREAFKKDADAVRSKIEEKYAETQQAMAGVPGADQLGGSAGQEASQDMPGMQQVNQPDKDSRSALVASRQLRAISELQRDVDEAILAEINKVSKQQAAKVQRYVFDDLLAGGWEKAFSEFIDDFTIYPTAFMKGPIVTTKKRLTYKGGVPYEIDDIVYENSRVCPLDVYPSPSAATVQEGNFIEHIRLTRKDLSDLAKLDDKNGYKHDAILEVLEQSPASLAGANDQKIEEAKARLEKRGSQTSANHGIYHGYHFWGTASVKMLLDWGIDKSEVENLHLWEEVEIEAILVNHTVIKCSINSDPLGRRPYYAASFQQRSGSIWGKSLPYSMRSEQRMCNATARALSDNMGFSSGPQMAILIDRLADDGDISESEPHMVWQFVSDPQGNGGKPIEFFNVPSNAQELLAVYDKFELKADDATGIPRYSYGNENVGGAGQTMGGLSILMESASKGIKDAIGNISKGVIQPRAEYQFYLHLLRRVERNEPIEYHGDVEVVVYAAEAITLKAAEQESQRELLKATANEFDMAVIGNVGRADMLRQVFRTANFPEDIIPSRLEVKIADEEREAKAAQQAQAQAQEAESKNSVGLQATREQVQGQERMHEQTQQVKLKVEQIKSADKQRDQQLKAIELDQKQQRETSKMIMQAESADKKLESDRQTVDKKLAVDISKQGSP